MIQLLTEGVAAASIITGAALTYFGSRPERGDLLVLQGTAAKQAFRAWRRRTWARRLGRVLLLLGTMAQLLELVH